MPYHRLTVYRKSYQLALEIHRLTLSFPKIEQFELASQLRRSSKSISANIAEGMGKQESKNDVRHYIRIAIGSCDESRVWLDYSKDLGYINENIHRELNNRYIEVGKMLNGLIKRYTTV